MASESNPLVRLRRLPGLDRSICDFQDCFRVADPPCPAITALFECVHVTLQKDKFTVHSGSEDIDLRLALPVHPSCISLGDLRAAYRNCGAVGGEDDVVGSFLVDDGTGHTGSVLCSGAIPRRAENG
jgi:hypothetical protein